jgi:hypothetical protein
MAALVTSGIEYATGTALSAVEAVKVDSRPLGIEPTAD